MAKRWLANVGLILLVVFAIFVVGYYSAGSPTGLARQGCGDGVLVSGFEQCDDGNRVSGDGCSSNCRSERRSVSVCGNGILEPTELCDDSNRRPGDGCDAFCFIEVTSSGVRSCGNGVVDSGEQCDDGGICTTDGRTACRSVSDCPAVRVQRGRCAARSGDGCDFRCRIEGGERTESGSGGTSSGGTSRVEVENSVNDGVEFDFGFECISGECSATAVERTASQLTSRSSSVYAGRGRFIAAVSLQCTGEIRRGTVEVVVGSSIGTNCDLVRVSHVPDSGDPVDLSSSLECAENSDGSLLLAAQFNGCSDIVVWLGEGYCRRIHSGQIIPCIDNDGDGYCQGVSYGTEVVGTPAICPNRGEDCHDGVSGRNPGATENCFDFLDSDCDRALVSYNGCGPFTCVGFDGFVRLTSSGGNSTNPNTPVQLRDFVDICASGSNSINQTRCRDLGGVVWATDIYNYYILNSLVSCPSGTTCQDPDGSGGATPAVCS